MFTCQIIKENESTEVIPEGELAFGVCRELEGIVSGRMSPGALLSFNMGKVTFLDSAGVGFLLKMKRLAEALNGFFEMRHVPDIVRFVLDKLALNEFLNVSKEVLSGLDSRKNEVTRGCKISILRLSEIRSCPAKYSDADG